MNLRKLEQKDAPLMLEWMHDPDVVQNMQADFAHKTLSDCENFIRISQTDDKNLHLAVVDDNNTYMDTVSLKNIENDAAESAVTIRKSAMGKGFSKYAMSEIIRIGLENLNLKSVYWCVSPENKRAVKFYDKNGYTRVDISKLNVCEGEVLTTATPALHLVSEDSLYCVNCGQNQNSSSWNTIEYLIPAFCVVEA